MLVLLLFGIHACTPICHKYITYIHHNQEILAANKFYVQHSWYETNILYIINGDVACILTRLTFYNLNPTSKLLGSPSYARIVLLARKTALAFLHNKNHCFWVLVL